MIENMLQKMGVIALLLTAGFLTGCGTSTPGPEGSKHQTQTGISETGYPGGQPVDAESPALGTSNETKYADPVVVAKDSTETSGTIPAPVPEK